MPAKLNRQTIFQMIAEERARQDAKFYRKSGEWPSADGIKALVLQEETGEIARAILEHDRQNLLEELVQTAAVCVAWLETLDASGEEGDEEPFNPEACNPDCTGFACVPGCPGPVLK